MVITTKVENPCLEKKDFCRNCHSRFMTLRPSIKAIAISTRFARDLKDEARATTIMRNILDCSRLEFNELHKFERNIQGTLIFRARQGKAHVVYGVDKRKRIIFLRVIRNFTEYKKLLDNDKEILRLIMGANDVGSEGRKGAVEDAN